MRARYYPESRHDTTVRVETDDGHCRMMELTPGEALDFGRSLIEAAQEAAEDVDE